MIGTLIMDAHTKVCRVPNAFEIRLCRQGKASHHHGNGQARSAIAHVREHESLEQQQSSTHCGHDDAYLARVHAQAMLLGGDFTPQRETLIKHNLAKSTSGQHATMKEQGTHHTVAPARRKVACTPRQPATRSAGGKAADRIGSAQAQRHPYRSWQVHRLSQPGTQRAPHRPQPGRADHWRQASGSVDSCAFFDRRCRNNRRCLRCCCCCCARSTV